MWYLYYTRPFMDPEKDNQCKLKKDARVGSSESAFDVLGEGDALSFSYLYVQER